MGAATVGRGSFRVGATRLLVRFYVRARRAGDLDHPSSQSVEEASHGS
jgi:hypothetical protein